MGHKCNQGLTDNQSGVFPASHFKSAVISASSPSSQIDNTLENGWKQ